MEPKFFCANQWRKNEDKEEETKVCEMDTNGDLTAEKIQIE